MGHYSTLRISSDLNRTDGEIAEHDICQEVKYAIPMFWLALFKTEDITSLLDEDGLTYYVFRSTIFKSCKTFKTRLNIWSLLYDDEKAEILAKWFLKYLENENIQTFSVELNVNDILGMAMDPTSEEAESTLVDMIHVIEQLHIDPKSNISFKAWLSTFTLKTPQDRYTSLDGFGEELLPCPEVDEWLKKNETEITQDYIESNMTEYGYSIDEETFYRILITKGEVFSENLLGFQHRYTFLVRISDSKKRTIFVNSLLIAEIIYFAFFWFILVIIGVLFSWSMINNTAGKAFATIATLGFITWYFWKKITYRINLLKNLKPMIS